MGSNASSHPPETLLTSVSRNTRAVPGAAGVGSGALLDGTTDGASEPDGRGDDSMGVAISGEAEPVWRSGAPACPDASALTANDHIAIYGEAVTTPAAAGTLQAIVFEKLITPDEPEEEIPSGI